MEYREARELLIFEGASDEGIYMSMRANTDPGHERMMRIVEAVNTLIANEDLSAPLDRKLAYSLFVIVHRMLPSMFR